MGVPAAGDLLDAVAEWLATLAPTLSGRAGFDARVAGNVLDIVARELALQPETAQAAAYAALLGPGATAAQLCDAVRAGRLGVATPGLLDGLIAATVARLAVDNPRYATLARLTQPPR